MPVALRQAAVPARASSGRHTSHTRLCAAHLGMVADCRRSEAVLARKSCSEASLRTGRAEQQHRAALPRRLHRTCVGSPPAAQRRPCLRPAPQMGPGGITEWRSFDTADGLYDCVWSEENENILVSASGDGSIKVGRQCYPGCGPVGVAQFSACTGAGKWTPGVTCVPACLPCPPESGTTLACACFPPAGLGRGGAAAG